MADTTTTAAKTEVKTEARTEAKDATATDAGSGKETESSTSDAESSTSDAPTGYSRGENQKPVTDAYRNNWNDIFGKRSRRRSKK
jgi:hypothetical protein